MEKRKTQMQAFAVIIFSLLLVFAAAGSSASGREELGELKTAMRNLNRANNLQMSYVYAVRQNDTEESESMDLWADLLTGSWLSEYYTADEDGTRLYLRQFCDGRNVYHYIDWNGDWELQSSAQSSTAVPRLEEMTTLGYSGADVSELEREEQDGGVEIRCLFAPEYLEQAKETQLAQLEQSYAYYEKSGANESEIASAQLAVEQHRQSQYEAITVTYRIDENQVLRTVSYEITMAMPEIVHDLDGNELLGKERQVQITLDMEIECYDRSEINDRIKQCRDSIY